MFTAKDKQQIESRGMTVAQVEHQLRQFGTGFPFLRLKDAAAVGNGIIAPDELEQKAAMKAWLQYKEEGHKVEKFVPASGAASRMFKNMFAFLDASYNKPQTNFEKAFFAGIGKFAFHDALNAKCLENEGADINGLMAKGDYKAIVDNLLLPKGLNYGQLPKGLLLFHNYEDGPRTPMEEHLVEAALYASSNGTAHVHFTVSHDHLALFEQRVKEKVAYYEQRFGVRYVISFSEQKPRTDTIAANPDNTPFRNDDGSLLFRPGGHGALIENLNDIDADVVFIKNIDNVVPDRMKAVTVTWKDIIAGVLVEKQRHAFDLLRRLDKKDETADASALLQDALRFLEDELCCRRDDVTSLTPAELADYLHGKLNRPMRVCGVVRNVGEPGGGPFLAYNPDGSVSLQILESSQIDKANKEYVEMFRNGTHFNPVDLVCATKDYKGNRFNLPKYVDPATGFISSKSKNGRELKALELPGLWNGAMSDWNTIFVEVPLQTFNPVKTVNDLLRDEHQNI